MATLSVTIPDNDFQRVLNALCNGSDVSEEKAQAALASYVKGCLYNYEVSIASEEAETQVLAALENKKQAIEAATTSAQAVSID